MRRGCRDPRLARRLRVEPELRERLLAASCSAAFFDAPLPTPSFLPSTSAAHVKRRSCGGPSVSTTSYFTDLPSRASASCSSVLWSTKVVSAYSIRPENAATTAFSIGSKPCSRKSAPSAASRSAARTLRLRTSRSSSSSGSDVRRPSPGGAGRARARARRRRSSGGRRRASGSSRGGPPRSPDGTSYSARAIASSRTLSPRNSRRSYESVLSDAHDECVKTRAARFLGSASISRRSGPNPPACCDYWCEVT